MTERRDVDNVVLGVGSRRHDDDNDDDGSRRLMTTTTMVRSDIQRGLTTTVFKCFLLFSVSRKAGSSKTDRRRRPLTAPVPVDDEDEDGVFADEGDKVRAGQP